MDNSSASSSSSSKSRDEVLTWINRIITIQQEAHPDTILELQRKAERSKRAMDSAAAAYRSERSSALTSANMMRPLKAMSAPGVSRKGVTDSITSYVQKSDQLRKIVVKSNQEIDKEDKQLEQLESEAFGFGFNSTSVNQSPLTTLSTNEEVVVNADPSRVSFGFSSAAPTFGFSFGQQRNEQNQVFGFGSIQQRNVQNQVFDEITELLKELEIEPTDDLDVKSKFSLFEELAKNVDIVRSSIYKFWSENEDQFENNVKQVVEKDIKSIDNFEAIAITDDPRKWFVYHMALASHKNNRSMTECLRSLRARLELIAQKDLDCPCCLEKLDDNNTYMLSCCHRICKECMSNWIQIKGVNNAFCPICKGINEAFLPDLLSNFQTEEE